MPESEYEKEKQPWVNWSFLLKEVKRNRRSVIGGLVVVLFIVGFFAIGFWVSRDGTCIDEVTGLSCDPTLDR